MRMRLILPGFAAVLISMLCASSLPAQSFSVDLPTVGLAGDDIFSPTTGTVVIAGSGMGFEVDAFSYHSPVYIPDGANFSVSFGTAGLAGSAVAIEAAKGIGEEAPDVFFAGFMGTNVQILDGDGSSAPTLVLPDPTPAGAPQSLDALDATPGAVPLVPSVFFSVDTATATTYGVGGPADVYTAPPGPGYTFPGGAAPPVYAPAAALGLVAGDDIDGLHYMEDGTAGAGAGDVVYFSLTPPSTSLGLIPASPADILVVRQRK